MTDTPCCEVGAEQCPDPQCPASPLRGHGTAEAVASTALDRDPDGQTIDVGPVSVGEPLARRGEPHLFHFAVSVQGANDNWVGEQFKLTVRAYNLQEACARAAEVPFPEWAMPPGDE